MEKDPQSHAIIGAAMEVHRELGRGFLELAKLTTADDAQLLNELKATGYQRGLLLNFGSRSLEVKRLVRTLPENLRSSAKSAENLQEITL